MNNLDIVSFLFYHENITIMLHEYYIILKVLSVAVVSASLLAKKHSY